MKNYLSKVFLYSCCFVVAAVSPAVAAPDMSSLYLDQTSVGDIGDGPQALALSPDGESVWFVQPDSKAIGRFTIDTRAVSSFAVTDGASPAGIATDAEGDVWFTLPSLSKVVQYNPSTGNKTDYPLSDGGQPNGIAVDQELGYVWFSVPSNDTIKYIDQATGLGVSYNLTDTGTGAGSVTVDSDHNAWIALTETNELAKMRYQLTGSLISYNLSEIDLVGSFSGSPPDPQPTGVTSDTAFGARVWVAAPGTGEVARYLVGSSTLSEYGGLTGTPQPFGVAAVHETAFVTLKGDNSLGYVNTSSGDIERLAVDFSDGAAVSSIVAKRVINFSSPGEKFQLFIAQPGTNRLAIVSNMPIPLLIVEPPETTTTITTTSPPVTTVPSVSPGLKVSSAKVSKRRLTVKGRCSKGLSFSKKFKLTYKPKRGKSVKKSFKCKSGKWTVKVKVAKRKKGKVTASYPGSTGIKKMSRSRKVK